MNVRKAAWLTALVPPLFVLWAIVAEAPNVGYADEWRFARMWAALVGGQDPFAVLSEPHINHRIFVPSLIALPLMAATDFDTRALMLISWLEAVALWALIVSLCRRAGAATVAAPAMLVSMTMFSLVHRSSYFDGFQFVFNLTDLAVCAGIVAWCRVDWSPRNRFAIAVALFWAASFSELHGFAGFVAAAMLTPLVVPSGGRVRWAAGFALAAAAAAWLHGLPEADHMPSPSESLTMPLQSLWVYVALAGAPFHWGVFEDPIAGATLAGCVSLAAFAACVAMAFLRQRRDLTPLAGIGLFVLGYLAMTTIGRAPRGLWPAANLSRYMLTSALLLCVTVCLAWLLWAERRRGLLLAAYAALASLLTVNSWAGWRDTRKQFSERAAASALLPFLDQVSIGGDYHAFGPFAPLFVGYTEGVRRNYGHLQRLGFRPASNPAGFSSTPADGAFERIEEDTHWDGKPMLRLIGRASPGVIVGLTTNQEDQFLTLAHSGDQWIAPVSAEFLLPGENRIRAWAYRQPGHEFRPLADETAAIIVRQGEAIEVRSAPRTSPLEAAP